MQNSPSLRVEFAPEAWSQLGAADANAFRLVRAGLEQIAELAMTAPLTSDELIDRQTPLTTTIGGWTLLYRLSDERLELLSAKKL